CPFRGTLGCPLRRSGSGRRGTIRRAGGRDGADMTDRIKVILESEGTDADLAAVVEIFGSAGIPAEVKCVYARESAEALPWLMEIQRGLKYLAVALAGVVRQQHGTGFSPVARDRSGPLQGWLRGDDDCFGRPGSSRAGVRQRHGTTWGRLLGRAP